ncbi:hypothetical protein NDA14_000036 [Ustilago hordei]|nr:hypothetical protein NDA14_000036 [Ustilago hordei]
MAAKPPAKPAAGPPEAEASTFRKAPTDVNRIPGSAASMKVQERSKTVPTTLPTSSKPAPSTSRSTPRTPSALRTKTAIQTMQPFLDSSTTSSTPIQPTDIQLLTTSILSNQERQRVILYYQEKLIDFNPNLLNLKKSLLFLSSSSWGQILEERKLAGKCSYPPCSKPSPSAGAGGRGKFRISLRNKSIKAVEDLNLGEAGNTWDDVRDYFCSKSCYARSEWILRWVLSDKEIGLLDESASKGGNGVGGGGSVLGGKWQKLTNHPHGYEQVELLEDIERESGVDIGQAENEDGLDGLQQVDEKEGEEAKRVEEADKAAGQVKVDAGQINKLMGDLTIIERTKTTQPGTGSTNPSTSIPAGSKSTQTDSASAAGITSTPSRTTKPVVPSRTVYDIDVPNTLGSRFTRTNPSNPTSTARAEDEEDDMDLRERELSSILRFASLAPASRPRQRNTTIRIDSTPSGTAANGKKEAEGNLDDDREENEPILDPKEAKERSEIRRIMDLALDVRADQRELGLLN